MKQTKIFKKNYLSAEEIAVLAKELEKGAIGVFPTDTVYGIGTGALAEKAVAEIYQIKNRPASMPLQLLTAGVERSRALGEFSPQALRLARKFWPGALTLVVPPADNYKTFARGFKGLGLRVPQDNFLEMLLDYMKMPLATTSANLHGQPVWTQENPVVRAFEGKVDFIVLGGTLSPTPSSVVDCCSEKPVLLREGQILRTALETTLGENVIKK